jgi:hypothetical protein
MMEVADQALKLLQRSTDPVSDIKRSSAYWIPLQWLYCKFLTERAIPPLEQIRQEQKRIYWNEVKNIKKDLWVKKWMCQSLYLWDSIKDIIDG